ncbi:MAG: hypothetical protein GXP41_03850 [Chloroflexi bacterium]|nr:hypothetical protein [Chloroflexota bacterium]
MREQSMALVLFEDEGVENFLPLTWTRPVWDLRCGLSTLGEKLVAAYPENQVIKACRRLLEPVTLERSAGLAVNRIESERALFLNGRLLARPGLSQRIPLDGPDGLFVQGEAVVAARLGGANLERIGERLGNPLRRKDFGDLPAQEVEAEMVQYPWNLVHRNPHRIESEAAEAGILGQIEGNVNKGAHLINAHHIAIARDSVIKPGVVLDASSGPIIIGRDVLVMSHAVIEGPTYIGDGSKIKVGAKIYAGTTIGPVCKIGGEVDESIFQGYSNKQHDGFVGHSYIGSWVNIGADTNTSDLKNNYSTVKVPINGIEVDSQSIFVGLIAGDHTKTGINTMFNTGTVAGVGCNLFGAGFPAKWIPSFSWGGADRLVEHRLEKMLDTARRVTARRGVDLTQAQDALLREVFRATASARSEAGITGATRS